MKYIDNSPFFGWCLECIYKHLTQASGHIEEGIQKFSEELKQYSEGNDKDKVLEAIGHIRFLALKVAELRRIRKEIYLELLGTDCKDQ